MEKNQNFYELIKGKTLCVAPMVEQSELAWRMLSREFGAQITWTPMFHAKNFYTSEKYRKENFVIHSSDTPLIVQFCANEVESFLNAALLVQDDCVAVELNLGCPQHIAKRGHYGAYLQDDWDLIKEIVSNASKKLKVPVTCKIRVFESTEKTIEYAKMIQDAGCALLTVHGRLRAQKGSLTGLADWKKIKAVKEALNIPVFANGNIIYYQDIEKCIKETGVDGVMTAEGNLCNPAIFQPKLYASWYLAERYMDIIKNNPRSATSSQAKSHCFKLLHSAVSVHTDLRADLGSASGIEEINRIVQELKARLVKEFGESNIYKDKVVYDEKGLMILPIWVAQPLIRKEDVNHKAESKREIQDDEAENESERKKIKHSCSTFNCKQNPSLKCEFKQCKSCCRKLNGGGCDIHKRPAKKRISKLQVNAKEVKPSITAEKQNNGSWCLLM